MQDTKLSSPPSPASLSTSPSEMPGQAFFEEGMALFRQCKYSEAIPPLKIAADYDYPLAYICLGLMCKSGINPISKNLSLSDYYLSKLAFHPDWLSNSLLQKPSSENNFFLGWCYQEGFGIDQDAKKAVEHYQKAADQGLAAAQSRLGRCYQTAVGVDKDPKKAVEYYQKAADQGHVAAQCNLGWCYQEEFGVEKDAKKAVEYYQKAANRGDISAQNNLGLCYQKGFEVQRDAKKAVTYYLKAIEQEHIKAQFNLGRCYQKGFGVENDAKKAVAYYQKASHKGYAHAQVWLGWCYKQGFGVEKDAKKAVEYFRKAADQGHAAAQCNLGWCYQEGIGIGKDIRQAMHYFFASQSKDLLVTLIQKNPALEPEAMDRIMKYLEKNQDPWFLEMFKTITKTDYASLSKRKAKILKNLMHLLEEIAQIILDYENLMDAEKIEQSYLGRRYAERVGVARDRKNALAHFALAADLGDTFAQNTLACWYREGRVVYKDAEKAFKYAKASAAQGDVEGYYNLGWCYREGLGVSKDAKKTVEYYQKAADQGYAAAQNNLGWCYQEEFGIQKDAKKAIEYYRKAANQSLVVAQKNLGLCYQESIGIDKDVHQAMHYFFASQSKDLLVTLIQKNPVLEPEAMNRIMKHLKKNQDGWFLEMFKAITEMDGVSLSERIAQILESLMCLPEEIAQMILDYENLMDAEKIEKSYLGRRYTEGIGVAKDCKNALTHFTLAADLGDTFAQNTLACWYREGRMVAKDTKKTFKYAKASAEQGDIEGYYNLALCYREGLGVSKDAKTSVEYYQKAADKEHAMAQNSLGWCYAEGFGVERDAKKTVEYYQKSARQRIRSAYTGLGKCYQEGWGVNKDVRRAMHHFLVSQSKDLLVALIQNNPELEPEAMDRIINHLKKKQDQWFLDIFKAITKMNYVSLFARETEISTRLLLFFPEKVAEFILKYENLMDAEKIANSYLGWRYAKGIGYKQDAKMGFKYYLAAAEQGYDVAQNNLGWLYQQGMGVDKNFPMAFKYFSLAAAQGFAAAQNNLAECYQKGWGVAKDLKKAIQYYQKAADQGYPAAQDALGKYYLEGHWQPVDNEKAMEYFLLSKNKKALERLVKENPHLKIKAMDMILVTMEDKQDICLLRMFKDLTKTDATYMRTRQAKILGNLGLFSSLSSTISSTILEYEAVVDIEKENGICLIS